MPINQEVHQRASSTPERRSHKVAKAMHDTQLHFRHSLDELASSETIGRDSLQDTFIHRHSAPILHRPSTSGRDTPESILMRANVRIVDVVEREGHCAYAIEVSTGYDTQIIYKRYSDIRDFRASLLSGVNSKKSHRCQGPCNQLSHISQVKFPSRRIRLPGINAGIETAQDRLPLLERFLQAMLRVYRLTSRRHMRICLNSNCSTIAMIKDFLELAEPVHIVDEAVVEVVPVVDDFMNALMPRKAKHQGSSRGESTITLFPIAEDPEHVVASA